MRELLLQAQELVLQPLADDGVDRAERLVHEHHRRIGGQRPRDADALALAARQLAGIAVAIARRIQADQLQQLVDARSRSRAASQPSSRGTTAMFSAIGLVREQADLLDDVADAPPQLDGGRRSRTSRRR